MFSTASRRSPPTYETRWRRSSAPRSGTTERSCGSVAVARGTAWNIHRNLSSSPLRVTRIASEPHPRAVGVVVAQAVRWIAGAESLNQLT